MGKDGVENACDGVLYMVELARSPKFGKVHNEENGHIGHFLKKKSVGDGCRRIESSM